MSTQERFSQIPPKPPDKSNNTSHISKKLDFTATLLAQETIINELIETNMVQSPEENPIQLTETNQENTELLKQIYHIILTEEDKNRMYRP